MLKLDHVVFPAWDVEASLAFYGETLGLPLAGVITGDDWGGRPWMMIAFALAEGRELVLTCLRGASPPADDGLAPDTRHYAFAVADEAQRLAWREKLRRADVAFWEEDHGDQQSVYFEDPNGVVLEITSPPSRAEAAENPAAALAKASAWLAQSRALTG
jgi:glyoxylase I family protein